MTTATQVLSSVFLLAGAALSLIAGIGLIRLPDVFARMHAATKPATLGLVLLATGAAIAVGTVAELLTLSLVVALQSLTAPTGAHLVGRAVARAGVGRRHLVVDQTPRPQEPQLLAPFLPPQMSKSGDYYRRDDGTGRTR